MTELLDNIGNEELPLTNFNNPFDKTKVTKIMVWCQVGFFNGDKIKSYGLVEFKNNNTEGVQRFSGDTFDLIVKEIKIFLKTLENNESK